MQIEWIIKKNFPEADFWLINRGSVDSVGEPTKEFRDCLIGLKCPEYVVPGYAFYLCQYLHQMKVWRSLVNGTLDYVSLNISVVRKYFQKNYTAQVVEVVPVLVVTEEEYNQLVANGVICHEETIEETAKTVAELSYSS